MSTPQECLRDDCPGQPGYIQDTEYCDSCFRKQLAPVPSGPPPAAPRDAATGPTGRADAQQVRPAEPPVKEPLDRDGLVVLPHVVVADAAEAATPEARMPSSGRPCPNAPCPGVIGVGYGGRPAAEEGYCTVCGTHYSFRPRLHPGDQVGEHYRVIGYLTPGGFGWVYLAEDRYNPEQRVVLKTMIDASSEAVRSIAESERHLLTTLRHRDIVRIITFEHHRADQDTEAADYIVMEYVGGRSLRDLLKASDTRLQEMIGGPLDIGHVITYGCKILGAFEYLHGLGWLYCDMKPDNVIHYEREIKIIDLGGVRRSQDRESTLVYDKDYAPPAAELDSRGFHTDTDLYTVGKTLAHLAEVARPATGLAARSFAHLVARATNRRPEARFTSAAQMSRQLWEVLREHRALTYDEEIPERSTLFAPTAELFGARLGTVRPLSHWTGPPRDDAPAAAGRRARSLLYSRRPLLSAAGRAAAGPDRKGPAGAGATAPRRLPDPLATGAPDPVEAARALPVPLPDPDDPATVVLTQETTESPDRIAKEAEDNPNLRTPEAAFWLCRAYLAAGDAERAGDWLDRARQRLETSPEGAPLSAEHDWRLPWHAGVLYLARREIGAAVNEFVTTYTLLPGEWAPKLALGFCYEAGSGAEPALTQEYYEAVWRRNKSQGSAALGLVRAHLRAGRRTEALAVLDGVPATSRHHDVARIAAVRVLSGRLGDTPPTAEQLAQAAEKLGRLDLERQAAARLAAEILETASACRPADGWGAALHDGGLFGTDGTADGVDRLYSDALRDLAAQAGDAQERGALLDRAYDIRPESRF